MNRIASAFDKLRERGGKAFVAYITAGDPSLETTEELLIALDRAGVDILEVGVPFSDPTADGPVIQAASERALASGTTLARVLDAIASVRPRIDRPIVLFGYYNPVFAYGAERFARKAAAAGVDGILVVDLPSEEAGELRRCTDPAGIDFISLITPTTSQERIRLIAAGARGFLYYVSITGVTGTERPRPEDVARDVMRIRALTDIPVVAGFGISTAPQAVEIAAAADGVVIGSALVSCIEEHRGKNAVTAAEFYARRIRAALDGL